MSSTPPEGFGVQEKVDEPSSWTLPSRKWFAAQVVAVGAVVVSGITTGWGDDEAIIGVGIAVEAITSYLIPNAG